MKNTIANIAIKYLTLTNYSIDKKSFKMQLETHPDYPSIKSISDTFDYFGIENLVARVPKNVLDQLPPIFITIIKKNLDSNLFLIERKNDMVVLADEHLIRKKITIEEFKQNWDSTVILVEENKNNIKSKLFPFEKIFFLFLGIITILLLFHSWDFQINIYSILSLGGLTISYFIIKEAFGIHNRTVAKVCEAISKTSGCSTVINNKNKIFGKISLSDVSFVYFLINFLSLVIIGFSFGLLICISIFSIPIVLFTLYYQGFILKQWCSLCLAISSVLALQFLVLISSLKSISIDYIFLAKYLFISILVILLWKIFKFLWIENIKLSKTEADFFKFKRNKELFDSLLLKDRLINDELIAMENNIFFGSQTPLLTINAVTNPLCGFCVESFRTYYKLLKNYKNIRVNFIFNVPFENEHNLASQIIVSILDIYIKGNKEKALEALHNWYEKREFNDWSMKYKTPEFIDDKILTILKTHQNWLEVNNVNYTPATMINNYYYPKSYAIEDLFLFVDDILLEQQKIITEMV